MGLDKADEYCEKLYDYSREYGNQNQLTPIDNDAYHCFINMINSNRDHILTDSFLNYLASRNHIIMELRALTPNLYTFNDKEAIEFRIVSVLAYYYLDTIENLHNDKKVPYFKLMDDKTKAAIFDAIVYINKLPEIIEQKNYRLFQRLVFYALGYCHYNNKILDFKETYKKILDNQNDILDDIKFHLIPTDKYPEYSGTALESFLRFFRNQDTDIQIL